MGRIKRFLVVILFLLLRPSFLLAEVEEYDESKNMWSLPNWTMRKCPKDLYATYDLEGAKKLKKADLLFGHCKETKRLLGNALFGLEDTSRILGKQIAIQQEKLALAEKRIDVLTEQLKREIAEKNKYKYAKEDSSWIYYAAATFVAVLSIGFGVGTYISTL